jgi:hypothetical protein
MTNIGSSSTSPAPPLPFIARFYGIEQAEDLEGRTLSQILNFDDEKLERDHDYIQVLFPVMPHHNTFPIIVY